MLLEGKCPGGYPAERPRVKCLGEMSIPGPHRKYVNYIVGWCSARRSHFAQDATKLKQIVTKRIRVRGTPRSAQGL